MNADQFRILFVHYTAPPVIGGVEMIIDQQIRLFSATGYPTAIVAGRVGQSDRSRSSETILVPEIDSEYSENLALRAALDQGKVPEGFLALQSKIEKELRRIITPTDALIAHNVMTTHFNLALTAAIHHLVDEGVIRRLIVWCHDISRYVNPASGEVQRFGFPWDLLRTYRSDVTYVAISSQSQRVLANVLKCSPDRIQIIPNGIEPSLLLGLSELGEHFIDEFGLLSVDLIMLMPIRITRAKNIEFSFKVAAALKRAGIRLRLIITGPPDPHVPDIKEYYTDLRNLQYTLSLRKEVIFIFEGTSKYPSPLTLEPAGVAELYRLCDLVLTPSHREGFSLPVLEAGLADKVIFSTVVPAVTDLGQEFEYLIEKDESPESVADRIREWMETDAAHRLRQRVRKKFTWSSIFAHDIQPLIAKVVSAKDKAS
ncbi:MAG TPA: glycosyltransferase family 4 protein [Anaerolineales bacterium]